MTSSDLFFCSPWLCGGCYFFNLFQETLTQDILFHICTDTHSHSGSCQIQPVPHWQSLSSCNTVISFLLPTLVFQIIKVVVVFIHWIISHSVLLQNCDIMLYWWSEIQLKAPQKASKWTLSYCNVWHYSNSRPTAISKVKKDISNSEDIVVFASLVKRAVYCHKSVDQGSLNVAWEAKRGAMKDHTALAAAHKAYCCECK